MAVRSARAGRSGPDGTVARTIGTGVVVATGLVGVGLQLLHLRSVPSAASASAGVLPPMVMALVVVAAGVWLFRTELDGQYVLRASAWCLLASAVFVLFQVVYVAYQGSAGGVIVDPLYDVVGSATVGSLLGVILGVYDVRRLAARDRLESARERTELLNQQLRVLNRVLRHDLRNDLAVVRFQVDLLEEHADPEGPGSLQAIREKVDEMAARSDKARSVEQLIERDAAASQRTDLVEVVEDVLDAMRRDHPAATIEADLPASGPVFASPLLDSAVRNVVENAVVHGGEAPCVDVTVIVEADAVALRVADDGPGIPSAETAVLKQGLETQLQHASGLGLWLVNWIVESSDGSVAFEENEPSGSVVTLRLQAA